MPTSDVAIANAALSKIGGGRITALTDDTPAGREVYARFEQVRDAELTRHTWRFTVKRTQLAALSTAPDFGFAYQYQLPTDCLRIIAVGQYTPGLDLAEFREGFDNEEYAVEGRLLLSHYAGPLNLRYVQRVTDPNTFDPAFAEAFAARLAYELATALSDSTSRKQMALADYQTAIREAIRANVVQMPPQDVPDNAWLASRN